MFDSIYMYNVQCFAVLQYDCTQFESPVKKKLSRLNMLKNPYEITHILTGIFIVMFALELL